MSAAGVLLVMTGPSGTGKSSVVRALLEAEPGLRFSVSHTTRPARPGERDGIDYRFLPGDRFEALRSAGAFVESARVHGHLYGTAASEIEGALSGGGEVLLDIDVQGAEQIMARFPDAVTVFIFPPDFAALESRLRRRGTESEAVLAGRLATAASEVRRFARFRYIVVNESVEAARDEIRAILAAERARVERRAARAEAIVATFPAPPSGPGTASRGSSA